MLRVTLVLAGLVLLAVPAATAQTVKETLDITRQAVETQRRVLVSGALRDGRPASGQEPVQR